MVRHRALAIGVSLVIGSSEENIKDMVTSSNEVKASPDLVIGGNLAFMELDAGHINRC
jgi:methylmalonyl-CoA mutase cobalamin-binding subunit